MQCADDLVVDTPKGLYCPAGDFPIDPWRAVDRSVITHAHADHARPGHAHYLASADSAGYGDDALDDAAAEAPA